MWITVESIFTNVACDVLEGSNKKLKNPQMVVVLKTNGWMEDELKIILLALLLSRQVRGWGCHRYASYDFNDILLNLPLHFGREERVLPSAWKYILFCLEGMELICDPSAMWVVWSPGVQNPYVVTWLSLLSREGRFPKRCKQLK